MVSRDWMELNRMHKSTAVVGESAEAVSAPWLAGTERAKTTGDCTAPLEILLVEDNAGDTILIYEIMGKLSFPVNLHLARDGEQALLMLSDHLFEPDLVILDLNLPRVSGYDVLERRPVRSVPVVVFSGSINEAGIQRSLDLGAQEYISKPLDLGRYQDVVRGIVERWSRHKAN
jgi:CheY-like chemotaxis protein